MTNNFDSSDQEDNHHLYATPTPASNRAPGGASGGRSKTPQQQSSNSNNTRFETDESREAALQRELEGVRNINTVIEGVISTLERAKGNMGVCKHKYRRKKEEKNTQITTPYIIVIIADHCACDF
jgi:DASH complex subunit Duo1